MSTSGNVLSSYLVKIGADPDLASFSKVDRILKETTGILSNFTGTYIKSITAIEFSSLGMFSAMGAGVIGLADKVAMTDQSYRLFGLRMLMNKDSARAMQMALDELGATIDEVAYDPELNHRFQFLYEQNMKMGKLLGDNFNRNMVSVRDLRMQFKMFENELEFLVMGSMSKLFDKLGFGSEDMLGKLNDLNNWFMSNLPSIMDKVSDYAIPVWDNLVSVVKDAVVTFKDAAGSWSFLTGVLLDDDSIKNASFDINNTAKALTDWIDEITKLTLSLQLYGKEAVHAMNSITYTAKATMAGIRGDEKQASFYENKAQEESDRFERTLKDMIGYDANFALLIKDFSDIKNVNGSALVQNLRNRSAGVGDLLQGNVSAAAVDQSLAAQNARDFIKSWNAHGVPNMNGFPAFMDSIQSRGDGWMDNPDYSGFLEYGNKKYGSSGNKSSADFTSDMGTLLDNAGRKYNINPNLLSAMIHKESNFNPGLTSSKGAKGLMQLMPGTAAEYGAKNPFNPSENVDAGAHYMSDLLKMYNGDIKLALAAYNAGPSAVKKYGGVPNYGETQDYVNRIIKEFSTLYTKSQAQGGGVIIENVNIQVPHALPEGKWKDFVHDSMTDIMSTGNKKVMAQTAGGAYY